MVPVGNEEEKAGVIMWIEKHGRDTVPFPLDKTKYIIRKLTDEEIKEQEE